MPTWTRTRSCFPSGEKYGSCTRPPGTRRRRRAGDQRRMTWSAAAKQYGERHGQPADRRAAGLRPANREDAIFEADPNVTVRYRTYVFRVTAILPPRRCHGLNRRRSPGKRCPIRLSNKRSTRSRARSSRNGDNGRPAHPPTRRTLSVANPRRVSQAPNPRYSAENSYIRRTSAHPVVPVNQRTLWSTQTTLARGHGAPCF